MARSGPVPGAGSSGVVPWPCLTVARPGLGVALPGCVFGVVGVAVVGVRALPVFSCSSSSRPAKTRTAPTTKPTATSAAAIPRHPTAKRLTALEYPPDGPDHRLGCAVLLEETLEEDR